MHHLRKQPADSPRPALCGPSDTSVLGWLENASGSRALTNQTFTRIAVDESDRASADLVLRGYFKGRGEFGPFHLERVYDEEQPIGYSRLTGDQLLNVNQRADWNKIRAAGKPLTFSEVVEILGGKSKASRFISACRNLGLVETDGHTMQSDRRYRFQPQNEQKP